MSVLVVVAIRDSAMDAFNRPWFVPASGMAVRSFADEVNRKDSEMNKHPSDFELYALGDWDEDTAEFHCSKPELLIRGKDVYHVQE